MYFFYKLDWSVNMTFWRASTTFQFEIESQCARRADCHLEAHRLFCHSPKTTSWITPAKLSWENLMELSHWAKDSRNIHNKKVNSFEATICDDKLPELFCARIFPFKMFAKWLLLSLIFFSSLNFLFQSVPFQNCCAIQLTNSNPLTSKRWLKFTPKTPMSRLNITN